MAQPDSVITVQDLHKSYGKNHVLRGVTFSVQRGTMLALLGPNGAGKTTTVRILSTLLKPDKGQLVIAGNDLIKQPEAVRRVIGLTGQSAAVDELLTGRENLVMMGRLYHLTKQSAIRRASELLTSFDLEHAADRPLKTYSGGMRRRLDLAVSLIAVPPIIFLDEPTTGLDPRSRTAMWQIIRDLLEQGSTILLTTQYLEEADQLADNIVVIDDGKVIAEGTANELKARVGEDRLELTFENQAIAETAKQTLGKAAEIHAQTVSVALKEANRDVRQALDKLAAKSINFETMAIHKPTLDDVFIALTGKQATKQPSTTKRGKR